MKEIYYVYNNEAIASCILLTILNSVEKLDIARSCLILPFLLDDRTINYLIKNEDTKLNLEDLIIDQSRLFVSFNKRYLSLLPVTINSLVLLNKGNQIKIKDYITYTKTINVSGQDLGSRFHKIKKSIPSFLSIIDDYSTEQLYKMLNVQL